MDQRIWDPQNTFNAGPYRNVNRVRVLSEAAINALRQYKPVPATNIARMFAFISYVQTLMGEHYCNGTPLSDLEGTNVVPGQPISNDSMFGLALANADSAAANLGGGDSAKVAQLIQVVRGRALLDRGQFAAAAAAVAAVPDNFHYDVEYSIASGDNQNWALNASARRYTLGDAEGTNGLNYRAALDPRIPNRRGPDRIFDTAFPRPVDRQGIWGRESSIKIASGIEARLIEAESALRAGDAATWLAKLNQLRGAAGAALLPVVVDTSYRPVAGTLLAALTDPGASVPDTLRIKLMFRERAFWMFATGHRLGDMRRLMRQYGRTEAQVYPIGPWFKGGNYGDAIQMPVPFDEQNNPNFVSCTDRVEDLNLEDVRGGDLLQHLQIGQPHIVHDDPHLIIEIDARPAAALDARRGAPRFPQLNGWHGEAEGIPRRPGSRCRDPLLGDRCPEGGWDAARRLGMRPGTAAPSEEGRAAQQ